MSKMKILIVDDDKISVEVLKEFLKNDYNISCVFNGNAVLETVDSFSPDLILLDIIMPDISGFDICEKISSNSKYADIPIIIITAKDDEKDLIKGFEAGAADYIKKPFLPIDVILRIKSVLKMRKNYLEIKELNTLKDEFVSMVSHDLKSPLTTISGYCEILLDEKINSNLTEKQKNMILAVYKSSRYQMEIIKNLLNISVLESGKMKIEKKDFLLIEVLNKVLDELKLKMELKSLKTSINFDDNMEVFGDPNRIGQVLLNLLGNAIKFTNEYGNIIISAHNKNDTAVISVSDDGVGISQEDIKHIFNPYDLYSTQGTKGEKGTGFGLSICMRIINAHNGKIWVESNEGQGSTFFFTIPKK